jgi:hypothetical protein
MVFKDKAPWGQMDTQWPQLIQRVSASAMGVGKPFSPMISISRPGHSATQSPSRLHFLGSTVNRATIYPFCLFFSITSVKDDNSLKSQKNRHPRESGGPELIEFPGFPFPDQVEDRLQGNDENGLSATFHESIKDSYIKKRIHLYVLFSE